METKRKPRWLYPHGVKGLNKLPVEDLRQFAHFNKVVLNYLMMCDLEEELKQEKQK